MDKLCLECKNLDWSTAEPGYSEYTPGSDMYIGCRKDKWRFDNYLTTATEWGKMLRMAETCEHFKK
jgi:hypothetical protein